MRGLIIPSSKPCILYAYRGVGRHRPLPSLVAKRFYPTPPPPPRRMIPRSFMSEVAFHNLSYMDIFYLSSLKNMTLFHLPCLCIYRWLRFSTNQMAYYILFNIMMKTAVDIWIAAH